MKIYNFHPVTGEYLNSATAEKSPLEKDVHLIPSNATKVKPPQVSVNQVACHKNGKWQVSEDYRGVEYWLEDGSKMVVTEIGEIMPENGSLEEIVPPIDHKSLINGEVQRRIFSYASANTQMNMTGAATADLLTSDQMEAYKQGLLWVDSMRSKGAELIANNTEDYLDDKHWPEPSAAAVALANAF